jgi:glutathione S-transferase
MTHRLVTIAISHYCEKARWALDRAGIAYVESAHVPMVHLAYTKPAGGRSTPLLVTPTRVITDSTEILRYADEALPEAAKLFPSGALGDEVTALEEAYDTVLGPAARVWAYAHLLNGDPRPVREALTRGCSRAETLAFRVLQGPIAAFMKKGFRLGPTSEAWALARIAPHFDEADRRLADGRRYLCGDRFTAADLTFAALVAPLVEGARPMVASEALLPKGFVEGRRRFRDRPSGEWVARLCRDERSRCVAMPPAATAAPRA